jgi:hypothetical protein
MEIESIYFHGAADGMEKSYFSRTFYSLLPVIDSAISCAGSIYLAVGKSPLKLAGFDKHIISFLSL